MQVFPDGKTPRLGSDSISADEAKAILERDASPIARMATETIEARFEPDPSLDGSTDHLLDGLIDAAGDSDSAMVLRRMRDRIKGPTSEEESEPPLAFSRMSGFAWNGDAVSDWRTDYLIIDGDLTIEGTLHLNELDELRCVVVLGSVTTQNFVCGGWVFIRDNLTCTHAYASSLNDGGLFVGGNMQVATFLETGQYVQVAGDFEAIHLAMVQNEIEVRGEVSCPDFVHRSDRDRLPFWVDPGLIEQHDAETEDGRPYRYWYPAGYDDRILAGGSPVRTHG